MIHVNIYIYIEIKFIIFTYKQIIFIVTYFLFFLTVNQFGLKSKKSRKFLSLLFFKIYCHDNAALLTSILKL